MKLIDQFEEGWWLKLSPFLTSDKFKKIGAFLGTEIVKGKSITPLFDDTFRAFKECPFSKVKVVIVGLDPYPGKGIADGLAFSARNNQGNPPKSLDFMLRAMEQDVYGGFGIGFNEQYNNSDLTRWANQGVLLMNTALSTVVGEVGAHLEAWQPFTSEVFKALRAHTGLVYILLGGKARQWKVAINQYTNYILEASHPSSCNYNGLKDWDCSEVFSKANKLIEDMNGDNSKIIW
jgi:uracil-DNA glycosylase